MSIRYLSVLLTTLGFCPAANVIANGGFESGLSSWNTLVVTTSAASLAATGGACAVPWVHGTSGSATACLDVANPLGSGAAYSSFDGFGQQNTISSPYAPVAYYLYQSFAVPVDIGEAQLSWSDSVNYNFSGIPREFAVRILDLTDSIYRTAYTRSFPAGSSTAEAAAFTPRTVDITSLLQPLAGHNVELHFHLLVPQNFTGPAGFGLDNVALNVTPVPEPATYVPGVAALLALAVRRRRQR